MGTPKHHCVVGWLVVVLPEWYACAVRDSILVLIE